jgi:hypothetical protein
MTLTLSRTIGRMSETSVPSGRRITTSWWLAASEALTCTTRGSSARAKASISRRVSSFTAKVASAIGSASV